MLAQKPLNDILAATGGAQASDFVPNPNVYLAFGDSISAGNGASSQTKRLSSLLAVALNLEEINAGVPGSQLRVDIDGAPAGISRYRDFDSIKIRLVTMFIGANDMFADPAPLGTQSLADDFGAKYLTVVSHFISLGRRVLVLDVTPHAGVADEKAALYRAQIEKVAMLTGSTFVRLTEGILQAARGDIATAYSYFFVDGLHPNDRGHSLICSLILSAIGVPRASIWSDIPITAAAFIQLNGDGSLVSATDTGWESTGVCGVVCPTMFPIQIGDRIFGRVTIAGNVSNIAAILFNEAVETHSAFSESFSGNGVFLFSLVATKATQNGRLAFYVDSSCVATELVVKKTGAV